MTCLEGYTIIDEAVTTLKSTCVEKDEHEGKWKPNSGCKGQDPFLLFDSTVSGFLYLSNFAERPKTKFFLKNDFIVFYFKNS